jgi:hypothetical protein
MDPNRPGDPMNPARALALTGFVLSLGAVGLPLDARAMPQGPRHSTPMPPPRDGDVAIREEFDAARRAGTREAYDLFIARHPQHALAAAARQERDKLPAR